MVTAIHEESKHNRLYEEEDIDHKHVLSSGSSAIIVLCASVARIFLRLIDSHETLQSLNYVI